MHIAPEKEILEAVDEVANDRIELELTKKVVEELKERITKSDAQHTIELNKKNSIISELHNKIKLLESAKCRNCAHYKGELKTYAEEVDRLEEENTKLTTELEIEKRVTARVASIPAPAPVPAPVPETISLWAGGPTGRSSSSVPPTMTHTAPASRGVLGGRRSDAAPIVPDTLGGRRHEVPQTMTRAREPTSIPRPTTNAIQSCVPRPSVGGASRAHTCAYIHSDGTQCTSATVNGYDYCRVHILEISKRIGVACSVCEARNQLVPVGVDPRTHLLSDICPACVSRGHPLPAISNAMTWIPHCTRLFGGPTNPKAVEYSHHCLLQVDIWKAFVAVHNIDHPENAYNIPASVQPQPQLVSALNSVGFRV